MLLSPPVHRLPVLVNLWLEPFFYLRLRFQLFSYRSQLSLEPFFGTDDLALEVEAAALLGFVGVEETLVALDDLLHVGLAPGGGLDVEDAAGLVEGHAPGEGAAARGVPVLGLGTLVCGGGLGLAVGGDEGAAEDP